MADPQDIAPNAAEPRADAAPPRTQDLQFTVSDEFRPRRPKPAGPQMWAVVLTAACLYFLWTRVLGKALPGVARRGGRRIGVQSGGGGADLRADVRAARERQQQRLLSASRGGGAAVRERPNAGGVAGGGACDPRGGGDGCAAGA